MISFFKKIDSILSNKKIINFLTLFLLVFIISIGYIDIVIDNNYTSDYVENVLWAEALLKSGRLLSTDFYWDYTLPLGGNIIMAPFVAIFGVGLTANKCGMAVFYSLYLIAVFTLSNSISDKKYQRNIFVAIVTMFIFTKAGQNLLHHILYYGPAFVCLIGGMGCSINIINDKNTKANYIGLLLWSIWGSANGVGQFALCNFSLFLSVILIFYFNIQSKYKSNDFKINKKYLYVLATIILASVIGFIINKCSMSGIILSDYMEENYMLTSPDNMYRDIINELPLNWIDLFYIFSSRIQLFSTAAIEVLFRIAFLIIISLSSIFCISRHHKLKNEHKIILYNSIIISLICFCEFVMTERYNSPNLLFNSLLMLFPVLAIDVLFLLDNKHIQYLIMCLVCCFICLFSFISIQQDINLPADTSAIDALKENNLHHGYAKYWSSNINTVLSNGKIRVASLSTHSDEFVPHYRNVDRSHFDKPSENEFFLLLTKEEYGKSKDICADKLSKSKKTIELDDYLIFIYDTEFWFDIIE